jgi:hypothetical protein
MGEISSNDPRPEMVGADSEKCQTLSVSLDDADTRIQWDVLVEVRRGEQGFAAIGQVRTHAVGSGPHNRVIVQAAVVGAVEWAVTCTPVTETVSPPKADIRSWLGLCVDECCAGTPGLFPSQYSSAGNE